MSSLMTYRIFFLFSAQVLQLLTITKTFHLCLCNTFPMKCTGSWKLCEKIVTEDKNIFFGSAAGRIFQEDLIERLLNKQTMRVINLVEHINLS